MRKLLFILFLIASNAVNAQNLIGENKKEIVAKFQDFHKGEVPSWAKTDNGIEYVAFSLNSGIVYAYYFNSNDVCYSYIILYPYKYMNGTIENLNKSLTIMGNNVWMDYNKDVDYKFQIVSREKDVFILSVVIDKIY